MLVFPDIDPVALHIGPLKVHWYGLSYLVGICLSWWQARRIAHHFGMSQHAIDNCITYAVMGIIIGGRLGFVLIYDPVYYVQNPLQILKTWQGGMSFHGGFVGVVLAMGLYCRRARLDWLRFGDVVSIVAPIGLFLGRIANFVNAEHFGRPSDAPWAVVFPNGGGVPRHPSQLYEALTEGVLLWLLLWAIYRYSLRSKASDGTTGRLVPFASGWFVFLFLQYYGCFRFVMEYYREPDGFLTILGITFTLGQWLSGVMIVAGYAGMMWAIKKLRDRTPV